MTGIPLKDETLTRIHKEDAGTVLAVLIRQLRDFDLAEDALQDAITEALVSWRRDGPPRNGAGWLLTVARRRAIDRIRRAATARNEDAQRQILADLEQENEAEADQPIPDERLRLIFTCCHPALRRDTSVALTLRTLCGLSTAEIARAYLVSETTMAQRLVRAKTKIRGAGIAYEVPDGPALAERLGSVLDVLYLIFNEGFSATEGPSPTRADLCLEAIRLGRILYRLMPHPEIGGLLALMLLHDGRRPARSTDSGDYVPIADQDRGRWDRALIGEGKSLLLSCLGKRRPGPFQVQAAISAVHADAPTSEDTDWTQIAGLYAALSDMAPSPIVTLNRAVAVAHAQTPEAGLTMIAAVADVLADYQPLHAARANLLKQCGRVHEAADAYRAAIALSTNRSEREFLERRLAEVEQAIA